MADLTSLYRGALIGQAISKQLGQGEAEGTDIGQSIRTALLQAGVASGKIKPQKLSSPDQALLSSGIAGVSVPKVKAQASSGVFGVLGDITKPITNTASDLVNAAASLPAGLASVGKAAFKTAQETVPFAHTEIKGPDLGGVAKNLGKQTVQDFTKFNINHPLFPILDVATAVSGGLSGIARASSAVSRLAAAGRAAETGADVGKLSAALGRSIPKSVGESAQRVSGKLNNLDRPAIPISSKAEKIAARGVQLPSLPMDNYSLSPFRHFAVEKPIDKLFQSKLGQTQIPLASKGTTAADLRGAYQIRKASNILRGRASAATVERVTAATQGFNKAFKALRDSSLNDKQALDKFDALVLHRELGVENLAPADRLDRLDQYRETVLSTGTPRDTGVPVDTEEAKSIRDFYRNKTAMSEFRNYFAEPDSAMLGVKDAWDAALLHGMQELGLDPHEVLQRSLGPAAHITGKTPEELLREQPMNVQRAQNFAMQAHDLEMSIKEAHGGEVPEEALIPKLAAELPGEGHLQDKIALVRRAVDSLRADIGGEHTPRELLNNAQSTGYLPGNNLAQKVAQELPGRLGVPEHVAEPFATGGLTTYFPSESALPSMHVRLNGGPISQKMNQLIKRPLSKATGGRIHADSGELGLHEFKRENPVRLLKAESLGVGPFAGFLQDADLNAFKAGVDRRDPYVLIRHINQRERVLTHRLLNERFIHDIAVKDHEGVPIQVANDAEKAEVFGSTVAASKYTIISPKAIQTMVQSEDKAALEMANVLKESGEMTPEVMEHVDRIVDEGAQALVRQTADEAIATKGKGFIVPNSYVNNLINHARTLDASSRGLKLWQGFISRWRTAVLAYMPSWLLRTTVGHGAIMFLGGVWNPIHYAQATNYFGDGFKIPGTDIHLTKGENAETPAGIAQGAVSTGFGGLEQKLSVGHGIAHGITGGVHQINTFQRRAAFLSTLNRVVKQHMAELGEAFELPGGLRNSTNLSKTIAEHPDWVHHTLNEVDRISYTFGQMAPWERRMAKNIIPFWGWYKFVSKFVWSLPLTFPGRALAISRLGQIGASSQDNLGPMPDWLKSSIMFNTHNLGKVGYISMLGLNPLGDVMDPTQGVQGLIRMGQMSPVIQAGLEAAGYNTMTGGLESIDPSSGIVEVNGKFIDTKTGKAYDSLGTASIGADIQRFFGGLIREFPEARISETVATGGRPVYPESIPLINEHPIPGTLLKNVSPLGILAQYAGVAPKEYNLQKYQLNLMKDIKRANTAVIKAKIKEKGLP